MTDAEPLFDARALARRLGAAIDARPGLSARAAAAEAGVASPSLHRALRGWPDLSHENFLRLERWLAAQQGAQEARAA